MSKTSSFYTFNTILKDTVSCVSSINVIYRNLLLGSVYGHNDISVDDSSAVTSAAFLQPFITISYEGE